MPPYRYDNFNPLPHIVSIGDIIRLKGEIPADALRRNGLVNARAVEQQGAITANTINNIAQAAASIPGAIQENRQRAQQDQVRSMQVAEAQRGTQDRAAMDAAFSPQHPMGPQDEGTPVTLPTRDEILSRLPGHLHAVAQKQFADADEVSAKVAKAQRDYHDAMTEDLAGVRHTLETWKGDPMVAQMQIARMKTLYAKDRSVMEQLEQADAAIKADSSPENILRIAGSLPTTEKYAELSKPKPLINRDPTHDLVDPATNQVVLPGTPKPPTPPAPPHVGSFEDYVVRKYGPTPTPEQITDARKTYGQADDRPRVNVSVGGAPGTEGGLTPDGLALAATSYRLTRQLPSRNASQNAAIMNEAAKQAKDLGQSPAAVIQKQAAQKSDAAALTKMTTMASAAEAFEAKANAQAGLVGELSKKVKRTDYPVVNGLIVSGKVGLGNTDAHLFGNALLTFTSEYAKIMEGATGSAAGSSDAARKDAARLISTALNNGTIQKTIQQMQWEMRQTLLGYETVIGHINDRIGGVAPAAAPATTGPAVGTVRTYNGETRKWNGSEWVKM